MMTTNGSNNEAKDYIQNWATMLDNIWTDQIALLKIRDTGHLMQSIQHQIVTSGLDTFVIEHFFAYYGVYVDRGTGKEFTKGNEGDIGITPKRKAKPWMSKKFYYYCMYLAEKLERIYGGEAIYIIRDVLEGRK